MTDKRHNRTAAERFARMRTELEQSESFTIEVLKIEITEQIYAAMERQGITKAELANRLNKSRQYVTKMLQGTTNLTLESLYRIVQALNCTLNIEIEPKIHASLRMSETF